MGLPILFGGGAPSRYRIDNSLRFRAANSAYLTRTPSSAGNRRTWTWSAWVKRGELGRVINLYSAGVTANDTDFYGIEWSALDQLNITTGLTQMRLSTAVFRDTTAWYHIVVASDTTQATASNRLRVYVNGVELTAFNVNNNIAQNTDTAVNSTQIQSIGRRAAIGTQYDDSLHANEIMVDGQALTPSSFGQFDAATNQWVPRRYSGTYGTNGFLLEFKNATSTTTIGNDTSGNGNHWTTSGISVTAGVTFDQSTDTPTNNFATLNPLDRSPDAALSEANTRWTYASNAYYPAARSTIHFDIGASQRWVAEFTKTAAASGGLAQEYIGVIANNFNLPASVNDAINNVGTYYYMGNGNKSQGTGGAQTVTAYGATYAVNDVIGVVAGNGQIEFFKNGVSQGVAFTGLTGTFSFAPTGLLGFAVSANYGSRPFAHTYTGALALNTSNLP